MAAGGGGRRGSYRSGSVRASAATAATRSRILADVHLDTRRAVVERAVTAVGDVRSCARPACGRSVHQLQPVHVVSRGTQRAVRSDDVPAVSGGATRHHRGREYLAVRRMAVVADGTGRPRSDLLRAGGERARLSGIVAAV